eukprot:jgi/Botrbrau1/428/Bobra.110_2s0078.1
MVSVVATTAVKGRARIAGQNFTAGDVILEEYPILLVVDQNAKDYTCARCLRLLELQGSNQCQACNQVAFCSSACRATASQLSNCHSPQACRCLGQAPFSQLSSEHSNSLRFLLQAWLLCQAASTDPGARGAWESLMEVQAGPVPPDRALFLSRALCTALAGVEGVSPPPLEVVRPTGGDRGCQRFWNHASALTHWGEKGERERDLSSGIPH